MKRYTSVCNWRLQYLPPSEYHWWQKVTVLLTKQLISNRNGTYININLIYTPFWLYELGIAGTYLCPLGVKLLGPFGIL